MPTYDFLDETTGEYIEITMTMAEREEFVKTHPHMIQQFNKMNLGDAVRLGIQKPPSDFMKYVLGRAKEAVPKNRLKDSMKFQIPKEI